MSIPNRLITGIGDISLLRSVAEDVPDMELSVREHLRHIADKLEFGDKIATSRCPRCGTKQEVRITMGVVK